MTVDSRAVDRTVSVIVPLFNGAAHIEETLTSIQRQSAPPAQVIVVDDGSTDGGGDLARSHPIRATVCTQPNAGVAVARNNGLSRATGDLVAFLDQDDLWHPDHLSRALSWFAVHPGERILFVRERAFTTSDDAAKLTEMDELAGGWASLRVSRDDALAELIATADVSGDDTAEVHDVRAMLRGPALMTTSFVADPHLLRLAGGFAPHALAMDDYWLLVNVARLSPIHQVNQPTVFYRVHTSATSRSTRLGLPFLSSAAALRLGGGLIPTNEGLTSRLAGGLHGHLLRELLASPDYRRKDMRIAVASLARLNWPPDGRRVQRIRALVAARLPWLRGAVRRIRGGVR